MFVFRHTISSKNGKGSSTENKVSASTTGSRVDILGQIEHEAVEVDTIASIREKFHRIHDSLSSDPSPFSNFDKGETSEAKKTTKTGLRVWKDLVPKP